MSQDGDHPWFDRFVYRQVLRTARRLAKKLPRADRDEQDLFQELALHLVRRMARYDSRRGHPYPFVTAVLERYASNLLRKEFAAKRDPRRVGPRTNGPSAELPADIHDKRLGRRPRPPEAYADLKADLRDTLRTLPEDLQELAERLRTQTVSEISRETEIPPSTLRDAVRQIRRRFERNNLHRYLEKRRDLKRAPGRFKVTECVIPSSLEKEAEHVSCLSLRICT